MATIYVPAEAPAVRVLRLLHEAADAATAGGLHLTASARLEVGRVSWHDWSCDTAIDEKDGGQ